MRKQNKSTSETKKLFIESFWLIYSKQPIEKITISELSKVAGYNRSTFYEYFTNIHDVLHQAEDELITMFQTKTLEKFPEGIEKIPDEQIVKVIVEIFNILGDRLFILIGENGDPSFQDRLQQHLSPFTQHMMGINCNEYTDYIAAFAYSALVSIFKQWHKNDKSVSKEKIIRLIFSLVRNGVLNTVKKIS